VNQGRSAKRPWISAFLFLLSTAIFSASLLSPAHAVGTAATAPTNIVATAGSGSIIVAWAAPAYPGDGVVNYSIDYSTDGASWTNASATIASSATSYTISGLTPGTPYYIRVTAINGAGSSPYGYPWTKLYSTSSTTRDGAGTALYDTGGGLGGSDTASVLASASFTRVKYHLQADYNSVTNYADADMAKWGSTSITNPNGNFTSPAATIPYLRIPDTNTNNPANQFTLQTNVQDLTVVSSNSSLNVSNKVGRLEIWPWNYTTSLSGLSPAGNTSNYDYDDQSSQSSFYGSFQVHDATDGYTVLAWNNQASGYSPDIGVGPAPGPQPDWTFCNSNGNCPNRSNFHLVISINIPVTPTAILSTTVALSGGGSAIFRTATTLTATASTIGKVTFYANGKRIPGCINVPTLGVSPFTATCSWRPSVHNAVTIKATFVPYTGLSSTSSTLKPVISARANNR